MDHLFFAQLFANRISGFFGLDLIVSSLVVWVFVSVDGRRYGVKYLWAPILALLTLGVSLGLPLPPYLREGRLDGGSVRSLDDVFRALSRSAFRRKFHLRAQEQAYLQDRGLDTVLEHARGFVADRLAPASPRNDGKQTPYRGHPVFVAQHATACCCRGCLEKFHGIPGGLALTPEQQDHVIAALERWIRAEEAQGTPQGG